MGAANLESYVDVLLRCGLGLCFHFFPQSSKDLLRRYQVFWKVLNLEFEMWINLEAKRSLALVL